jgi:uncharacterized protein
MWRIRPAFLPLLPVLSASHEFNVRTYVHLDGVPGVWFSSPDTSNALAVWGARVAWGLPYFRARMRLQEHPSAIQFASTRTHPGAPRKTAATLLASTFIYRHLKRRGLIAMND